jgi:hypothetical protein
MGDEMTDFKTELARLMEGAAKVCERVDFEGTHNHASEIRALKG